ALREPAVRAVPGRDGGRAPVPARPDLVARYPLLVPGARVGAGQDRPRRHVPHRHHPGALLPGSPGEAAGLHGLELVLRERALRLRGTWAGSLLGLRAGRVAHGADARAVA